MFLVLVFIYFFFFKQKTAYEMRISDWSSDVCSSDLPVEKTALAEAEVEYEEITSTQIDVAFEIVTPPPAHPELKGAYAVIWTTTPWTIPVNQALAYGPEVRSEEHTSELQSLMRTSYAVFCLKKKKRLQSITQYAILTPSSTCKKKQI